MNDQLLMEIVDKARTDDQFRSKAILDPDGTLEEYGYEPGPEELEAIRAFHSEHAGKSPDELAELLDKAAMRQGGVSA